MAIDPIPYHTMLHVVAYTTMYWHAVEAEAHCAVVRYIVTLQSSLVTVVLKISHPNKLYKHQSRLMSQHRVQYYL